MAILQRSTTGVAPSRHRPRTRPMTFKEKIGMAQNASLNRRKEQTPVTLERPPWEKEKR